MYALTGWGGVVEISCSHVTTWIASTFHQTTGMCTRIPSVIVHRHILFRFPSSYIIFSDDQQLFNA